MLARNRWLAALATVLFVPTIPAALAAQEGGKCDAINDGSPFQLKGAQSYIVFIADPGKKGKRNAEAHEERGRRCSRPIQTKSRTNRGATTCLLRLYTRVAFEPALRTSANRGTILVTRPTCRRHRKLLLMAIDTAATYLEKNVPQCKTIFQGVRNKYFVENLNKSIAAMKANNMDSTKVYIRYAQMLSPNDPRTWNVHHVGLQHGKQTRQCAVSR